MEKVCNKSLYIIVFVTTIYELNNSFFFFSGIAEEKEWKRSKVDENRL